MTTRTPALLLTFALIVAACGSDGGTNVTTVAPAAAETSAPTTTAPPTTTAAPATTAAPSTTTTATSEAPPPAGIVAGEDADVDAIVEVFAVVFDSTTTFAEKEPFIEDASGLEETVDTYTSTGQSVGGVTVQVTAVTIDGDTADVIYTLEFSGNPTYPDQEATATRTEAGWQVSRTAFCGVMASARSACPAS